MIDPPAAPPVIVRSYRADVAWVAAGSLAFAACSGLLGTFRGADVAIWWGSGPLAAVLTTTTRRRWPGLTLTAMAMFAAAFVACGHAVDPAMAIARTLAYALEGLAGGWLARIVLRRTSALAEPLSFGLLLAVVAVIPALLGAGLTAGLSALLSPTPEAGFAARWLGCASGDSFGMLGSFPLVWSLRRQPLARTALRRAPVLLALVALVTGVSLLSFQHFPRPFAFSSLALGAAALVAGPRTIFLLVWIFSVSVAWAMRHLGPGVEAGIAWQQLNVFLPVMAISAPIQVLSVAINRLNVANTVLQLSRERFRRLYDRAPVMLQSLDADGRTVEVNAQWLATLGYGSADEVRGLSFEQFLAPGEQSAATGAPPWHLRLLAGAPQKLHVRLRTRAGRELATLASAATALGDPQAQRGVVIAFEDVSIELAMRAQIERERDELAALTSATSDLSIFLDNELRYRSVNRAFERYWGISREAAIGRHPRDIEGQEFFATRMAQRLERALAGEASNFQATVDFPGRSRVMEVALAPAYDAAGAPAGVVATLHDVTDLVDATRELRQMVGQLQHANAGLEQFARIASHDLREPLNTILQFSGLIRDDFGAQLPPEAKRYFDLMAKASLRMKSMLDDVLQFARLGSLSTVRAEDIALDGLFANLQAMLAPRLARAEVDLDVADGLPPVRGQSNLVELLLRNLLVASIRQAAASDEPRVEVRWERDGDHVLLTIADNGAGVPAAELERMFEPFHRRRANPADGDSGLALAICRRLATALGGRVWAESGAGGGVPGTRFRIELEAARGPAP